MKKEIKDRWLEALRSDRYKQGREHLKYNNRFCCLGVLLDLTKDIHGCVWEHSHMSEEGFSVLGVFDVNQPDYEAYPWTGTIPGNIRQQLGIGNSTTNILINLNDRERKNFKEIADWIEENVPVDKEPENG